MEEKYIYVSILHGFFTVEKTHVIHLQIKP